MPSPITEFLKRPAVQPIVVICTILLLGVSAWSIVNFAKGGPRTVNELGSDMKKYTQAGESLGKLFSGQKVAIILAPEEKDNPVTQANTQLQTAFMDGLVQAGVNDIQEMFLPPMPTIDPGNMDASNVWFSGDDLIRFRKNAADCNILILPMGLPAFVDFAKLTQLPSAGPKLVVLGGGEKDRQGIKTALNHGILLAAAIPDPENKTYIVMTKDTMDQ
jgi:hypothetical protein